MLEQLRSILHIIKPDPQVIIAGGYLLMTLIVFVETGLLVGFALPGDSLLVTAGIFAAGGGKSLGFVPNIYLVNAFLIPAAILGDTLGYWIGYHTGPRLFRREKSWLFRPEHLRAAQAFYERHGGKTIVLARFMPIARTFAPVVAGAGRMDFRKFLGYNVAGGIGWVVSMTMIGFTLGRVLPAAWLERLDIIIVIVVLLSVAPAGVHFLQRRLKGEKVTLVEALASPDAGPAE